MTQYSETFLQEKMSDDSSTIKRILFNALEHFSRYGYTGASVREITHASQVTKPTLYYYFKNKEELYKKLAQTCFEEIHSHLEKTLSVPAASTKERAINLIKAYCGLCEDRRSVARFVHLMAIVPDRSAPEVGIADFNMKVGAFFRKIVTDGVSTGEVKEENVNAVIYALFSIFYLRVTNILANEPIPHDFSIVEEAVSRVLTPV